MGAKTSKYFLFSAEDMSDAFAVTAEMLLRWFAAMGVPWIGVSGTARHFKPRALKLEVEPLGTSHCFAVANSASTNWAAQCMVCELVHTFKGLLKEGRRPCADWVLAVPVVQSAFNAAYLERYQACLFQAIFGREPAT